MPGPWISNDVLTQDVAAAMQMDDSTQMGSRWSGIIDAANKAAAADLLAFLCGLGYTEGQVDGWDDRVEANRRLGLLYALQRGNPLGKIDAEMLKSLDPREAIRQKGSVSIGGIPTGPVAANSQVGGIIAGNNALYDAALQRGRRFRGCW